MTTAQNKENRPPRIGAAQVHLLERLCTADAVSGDEQEVRAIVLEQVRPLASELKIDALGNILVRRQGSGENRLRVMIAAHMDEVGLMVTGDEKDGIFRFDIVGGIDPRILAGKAVRVGRERVPAVIGSAPIHLTNRDERERALTVDGLRVDTGPANAGKVKVGDRAAFDTPFQQVGPSLRGKALDDRLGVASLIELVRHAPDNIDLLAAFTVQEEVGLRGARVAAYTFDPQLAFVLDCTPAHDLPSWDSQEENTRYNTHLGNGPAIYVADRDTISDPRLVRYLVQTAEAARLPYQLRQPGSGGTDAGAIHKQRTGIPSVSVSVPGRYIHTPVSIARLSDWKNTLALIYQALTHLPSDLFSTER
jgi:endoglucanase